MNKGCLFVAVFVLLLNVCVFAQGGDDLIAYWPFDEDTLDYSGNAVDGTAVGNPDFVSGPIGSAISIDGRVGQYINIGASNISPPWSVSVWARRKANTTSAAILDRPQYSLRLEQWANTNKTGITVYGVKDHTFNYTAPLNEWVHLVYVGTASDVSLYANGVLKGSLDITIDCPMSTIGNTADSLVADLDDIAVLDRALDAAEILQVYNAGLSGRPFQAGNVAWEPSPADTATGVDPAVGLSWSGPEDFNNLPVYDLYFGKEPQDWDLVETGISTTSYDVAMEYCTEYYWQVDVVDGAEIYDGSVWSFTTGGKAVDPFPAAGAENVNMPSTDLRWKGDSFATSYKVYAGTDFPLDFVGEVYDEEFIGLMTSEELTEYYWRVDEYVGADLTVEGDVWFFTTRQRPVECPVADLDGDCAVDFADLIIFADQWLGGVGADADLTGGDGVDITDFAVLAGEWNTEITSSVIITEIHYNPDVKTELVEFVELHNTGPADADISGWYFSDGISYTFEEGTILAAGAYIVVAQDAMAAYTPVTIEDKFAVESHLIYGPFEGKLRNSGEKIELSDAEGKRIDRVDYNGSFPWPTVGDEVPVGTIGTGHSIQLTNHKFDNDLAGSWRSAYPTPAAENTAVFALNIPPHIRQVAHSPKEPVSDEVVAITAKVTDPDGVGSVILQYQIVEPGSYIRYQYSDGSNNRLLDPEYETGWVDVVMHDDGVDGDKIAADDIFTVRIPTTVQQHRRLIRYRIVVEDIKQHNIRVPYADDPQPNFAYFVYDGVPAWTGAANPNGSYPENEQITYGSEVMGLLPIYHLIAKEDDINECQYVSINQRSEQAQWYQWSGTLVYDGEVYDNVWYRNRGWWSTYTWGKNKWKFDFNRGHFFQGRDDYGEKYGEKWDKLNFSACIQQVGASDNRGEQGMYEAITFKLFNLASVPASNTNWIHFRVIDDSAEATADQYKGDCWGMYMTLEQPDGRFLEEHNLPDGNLYKMFFPISGDSGNMNNQGPTQVTDHSDVESFCSTYHGSPSQQWWEENTQLDAYYSYRTIVDATHHLDLTDRWNCFYYRHPQTERWWMLPWDVDLSWDTGIYTSDGEQFKKVLAYSEHSIKFKNRMRELRDLLLNTDQCWQLIDEYAAIINDPLGGPSFVDVDRAVWDYHPRNNNKGLFYGTSPTGDFEGMVLRMKDFISPAGWGGNNIASKSYDAAIPDKPVVTAIGNISFAINDLRFQTTHFSDPQGNSTFVSMKWRIAEVEPAPLQSVPTKRLKYEIDAVWQSDEQTQFESEVTIPASDVKAGRTYRVRVRMKDDTGRWSHWSDPVEFIADEAISANILDDLRLTELMYNPADADTAKGEQNVDHDEFEFIELKNIGDELLDLTYVSVTEGIIFDFAGSEVTTLAPGEMVLIVKNIEAFESRYGTDHNIAGEYISGKLSNNGEVLSIVDQYNGTIADFEYNDSRGWPLSADGGGHSLVPESAAIQGQPQGTLHYGGNWRASSYIGGSPGSDDPTPSVTVLLNEIMAHTDYNNPSKPEYDSNDWIELYNAGTATVTLNSDWYLSDDIDDLKKWTLPDGNLTVGERMTFDEVTGFHNPIMTGFGLDKASEAVILSYLPGTGDDRVVDFVRFKGQENLVSIGRFPEGGKWWFHMNPTPDTANTTPISDIVITRIMYHPLDLHEEYILFHNPTDTPVNLFNDQGSWRIDGEVDFTFPGGLSIPAGDNIIVVGFDPVIETERFAAFAQTYNSSSLIAGRDIVGPWQGSISNSGGRLAIERPQQPDAVGQGVSWVIVDEVIFDDFLPWPVEADGQGFALERISVESEKSGNSPDNWKAVSQDIP